MSQKRKRSPDPTASPSIFRSNPIEDRSSTFIGYFSPSLKPEDLQNQAEFAQASHKILAWRRESNQQAITGKTNYVAGGDDDGEKYGGKKVEKVLESMQVTGSCVVARWYGGVMLGPVRFTHMEECAKGAVRKWLDFASEEKVKKLKVKEDEGDRVRLVKVLGERDHSILVLRTLAAEKEGRINAAKPSGRKDDDGAELPGKEAKTEQVASPSKPSLDYESFPVERLRVLEKARDATLAFLLKRINEAEAGMTALEGKKGDIRADGP